MLSLVSLGGRTDFQGKGEFCPTPYFYQNLGEAEYVVALYQYLVLLGYPSSKISILTTYNGQKHLIRDVLSQRCKHPVFGKLGHDALVWWYTCLVTRAQWRDIISDTSCLRDSCRVVMMWLVSRWTESYFYRSVIYFCVFYCCLSVSLTCLHIRQTVQGDNSGQVSRAAERFRVAFLG